jgi:hypothetical protein
MQKRVVLPGIATLAVLAVFFYLVGERGAILGVSALVPTLLGTLIVWNRARKRLAR